MIGVKIKPCCFAFTVCIAGSACHTNPYLPAGEVQLGPWSADSELRLTFNPGADYWPAWSQDGQSLIYEYSLPDHRGDSRCLGLLPALGGTQLWHMCDNRPGQTDSSTSFAAFALGDNGRLLYLEVSSGLGHPVPERAVLWLADTAHPFERREIARLPFFVADSFVNWLADATWAGPNTFYALAAEFFPTDVLRPDSVFLGKAVVIVDIPPSGPSTFRTIRGTAGAAGYSVVPDRNGIVFWRRRQLEVLEVDLASESVRSVAFVPSAPFRKILGISCKRENCIVATGALLLPEPQDTIPSFVRSPSAQPELAVSARLWFLNLGNGALQAVDPDYRTGAPGWSTPKVAKNSDDIVVQSAGGAGLLRLYPTETGDLKLLRNRFSH